MVEPNQALTPDPRRRIWTWRHYWPYFVGALTSAVYAVGLRLWADKLGIILPIWVVPVTAQSMLFIGVILTRLMMFDRK